MGVGAHLKASQAMSEFLMITRCRYLSLPAEHANQETEDLERERELKRGRREVKGVREGGTNEGRDAGRKGGRQGGEGENTHCITGL